jgi:hypothetical protein
LALPLNALNMKPRLGRNTASFGAAVLWLPLRSPAAVSSSRAATAKPGAAATAAAQASAPPKEAAKLWQHAAAACVPTGSRPRSAACKWLPKLLCCKWCRKELEAPAANAGAFRAAAAHKRLALTAASAATSGCLALAALASSGGRSLTSSANGVAALVACWRAECAASRTGWGCPAAQRSRQAAAKAPATAPCLGSRSPNTFSFAPHAKKRSDTHRSAFLASTDLI